MKPVIKNLMIYGGLVVIIGVALYDSPLHRGLILAAVAVSLFGNFWDKFFTPKA